MADDCRTQGYNALLSAAWRGNYRLCIDLIRRGAYVNQETHDNSCVWHVLAAGPQGTDVAFEWTNELRALMKRLADVAIVRPSSTNSFKETALHVAVRGGARVKSRISLLSQVLSHAPVKLVHFLVHKCGASELLEMRNASGETVCWVLCAHRRVDDPQALHYASRAGNTPLYEYLVSLGALVRRNSVAR